MPPKLYEMKVYKGRNQVREAGRLLESLDLTDPDAVRDLLRRHLIAVALRDGARRADAHMYHLDIHEVRNERPENAVLFTFSVPVEM